MKRQKGHLSKLCYNDKTVFVKGLLGGPVYPTFCDLLFFLYNHASKIWLKDDQINIGDSQWIIAKK